MWKKWWFSVVAWNKIDAAEQIERELFYSGCIETALLLNVK